MQGFPPFQKNMHSLGRRPAPSKLLHEGATLVTPVPTGRMEAIRGRTSSRASTGGATTVPRQSTSSLSSSRTSMDGMVPNAAARRRTTADDDRFLFTATTVDSLDGVSSSLCLPQKVLPCSNVQMARTGGRLQTSCWGRETPPSRGCCIVLPIRDH